VCVDNEQIGALHTENNRERMVNDSKQMDIDMVRAQLSRSEDVRSKQEAEILEQQTKINEIHKNYQEQMNEKEDQHQSHVLEVIDLNQKHMQAMMTKHQTELSHETVHFNKKSNEQKRAHDTSENQLQALCNRQQIHISGLEDDVRKLRSELDETLTDKQSLQKEVMTSSDYIVAVQEKCY